MESRKLISVEIYRYLADNDIIIDGEKFSKYDKFIIINGTSYRKRVNDYIEMGNNAKNFIMENIDLFKEL